MKDEAYLDIVWRQFKKNRAAYISLWLLIPVFLLAIFTPAIASNQPFVFHDGEQTIYPWFNAVLNPVEPVDYLFNMAMLVFPIAILAITVVSFLMIRREQKPRQIVTWGIVHYLGWIVVAAGMFAIPNISTEDTTDYWLRPSNRYRTLDFPKLEFDSGGDKSGVYAPIPFGPTEIDLPSRFQPPLYRKLVDEAQDSNDATIHWLGTGSNGRDVLTRMLYGTRLSLSVGFVAVSLYVSIGVFFGALAGYFGGKVDMVISRVIEIVLMFPAFFLILILVAMVGPSVFVIMFVIGVTGWPRIARLTRGEVLKQRAIEYTTAARAIGASHLRVAFRHILPNALSPALVAAPFGIAGAIIIEAGLSLLGFGVRPPTPSWGVLLRLGNGNYTYWWLIVVPSLAIFFTVTVFNLVGSGVRDAMDPRLRQ